jgi:hypothetical protein
MPSSGCIALRNCISGIPCSSISCAVNGSVAGDCSLSSLYVSACGPFATSAAMTDFYGYTPPVQTCVNFSSIASCTGSVACNNTCLNQTPTASVGNSFCACFCLWIEVIPDFEFGGCAMGCVRLICNASTIWFCNVTCTLNRSCSWLFNRAVDYNDNFCIITCASDCGYLGGFASARACLNNVTTISGNYVRCTPNCVITAAGFLPH